ncbi:MAG TPA: proton-conducting transporter membrane subunit [Chitinophagales bacterium]|nr:proton-conducting transporter membrane subunit [Chitinophagales bacterium]
MSNEFLTSPSSTIIFGGIAILFITIISILLLATVQVTWKGKIAFLSVLVNAVLSSWIAIPALIGLPVEQIFYGGYVFGQVPIRVDALSAWFILIVNFTCVTGVLYGIGYMKPYADQKRNISFHWILFVLFHLSMLSVCVIQNGLAFLIAWEIMSISSLLLVIFEHYRHEILKACMNYMVQMHIGVAFLSVAFIWVYFSEGSFDFSAAGNFFNSNRNVWLFLLFFAGFGIKAGFIPLHSWLPHAHPAAPSHVSGVMSGVIVKMGIYGIIRIALMLKNDLLLIGEWLLILSIVTGIYGILNAAVHRDFKKMLAYCTIENVGIIGAGIGLAIIGMGMNNSFLLVIGLSAALLHTLNHSLFKSLLFFSAGSVYQQTHTRDMEKLGGLVHKMPQTASLFLIGSLAIGGLPPLNGFVSEFILYSGFLHGIKTMDLLHSTLMILSIAGLAIIGGLSMLTFTKSFGTIFLGIPRKQLHEDPKEASLVMRIPQFIIVAVMLSIGIFPQLYFSAVLNLITAVVPSVQAPDITSFQPTIILMAAIGKYSFMFLCLLTLVFLIRKVLVGNRAMIIDATWGCGYVAPNNKMQYTGKSYSKTLGKLLGFITTEKKKYTELKAEEIFPEKRTHSSHYIDFFEDNIFDKFINRLIHAMGFFRFIQNGRIEMYVLYGVFFIVLIFLGSLFGFL